MTKKIIRSKSPNTFTELPDDWIIICRCEEITKGEIRRAVYEGMSTPNEIKRYLRAGMGLCQGQTCSHLIRFIVARELGIPALEVPAPTSRAPARPVEMGVLANDGLKLQAVVN